MRLFSPKISSGQAVFTRILNAKMDTLAQNVNTSKNFLRRLPSHGSSSSQSSEQSSQEVLGANTDDLHEPCITEAHRNDGTNNPTKGLFKPGLSIDLAKTNLLPQNFDYGQSFVSSNTCVPFPYADPYFGAVVAAYGPQAAIMHPQMAGMVPPGRIPLPLEPTAEPIYVNAKQYNGILRRRQLRAKLEAQNKLVKARKPYLHESRHLHALKRARGSGGRFLNTKNGEQQSDDRADDGHNRSGGGLTCNSATADGRPNWVPNPLVQTRRQTAAPWPAASSTRTAAWASPSAG